MTSRSYLLSTALAVTLCAGAVPTAHAANCSTTDINLTIGLTTYTPTACASNILTPPENATNVTNNMNSNLGTNFTWVAKDDGTFLAGGLMGIQIKVSNTAGNTGSWTVTWSDTNGPAPDNLPVTIDFDVGLDGGSTGDAYKFLSVELLDTTHTGTGQFFIAFVNGGGNHPAISGLNIAAGDIVQVNQTCTTNCGDPVPEPASFAMLGVGLLGLGFLKRRQS